MAMVALQNFSTGVDTDLELLAGTANSSSSTSSNGGNQQQEQQPPLTPEMRMALQFRSQRKQLLVDVIAALAGKLKQVIRMGKFSHDYCEHVWL